MTNPLSTKPRVDLYLRLGNRNRQSRAFEADPQNSEAPGEPTSAVPTANIVIIISGYSGRLCR